MTNDYHHQPLVRIGKPAPLFSTQALLNGQFTQVSLEDFKGKSYVVLFFYPLDFTFGIYGDVNSLYVHISLNLNVQTPSP
jgi:peroxiredoxin